MSNHWKRKRHSRKELHRAFLRQGRIKSHAQGADALAKTPLGESSELRIATPRGAAGDNGRKQSNSESEQTPAQKEGDLSEF